MENTVQQLLELEKHCRLKKWCASQSAWQYAVQLSVQRGGGLIYMLSNIHPEHAISATALADGGTSYRIADEFAQEPRNWARQWQAGAEEAAQNKNS